MPAAYMKICALLVPKEFKVEHTAGVKGLSDEELEQVIAVLRETVDARAGESAIIPATSWGPEILHFGHELRQKPAPRRDSNVANSPVDRRRVGRQNDPQRCSVTNGANCRLVERGCVGAPMQGGIASAGSRCWGGEDPHGPACWGCRSGPRSVRSL
jgi:hypothetical protein